MRRASGRLRLEPCAAADGAPAIAEEAGGGAEAGGAAAACTPSRWPPLTLRFATGMREPFAVSAAGALAGA